jgi:hypothetical protein
MVFGLHKIQCHKSWCREPDNLVIAHPDRHHWHNKLALLVRKTQGATGRHILSEEGVVQARVWYAAALLVLVWCHEIKSYHVAWSDANSFARRASA